MHGAWQIEMPFCDAVNSFMFMVHIASHAWLCIVVGVNEDTVDLVDWKVAQRVYSK